MATDAGSIKYTVDADTASMLKAEAVIDKSLTKISKEFDDADKAVRRFTKEQKEMGRTVNRMGQVLDKNGNIVEGLTRDYRKLATEAATSFGKMDTRVSKASKGVSKGIAGMGRSAGQAGIQFQQLIGQVQGGQGFMLALSQQSADLGFVLGAPLLGAVAGISASVIGMLVPALFSGKKAVEELEKITEELGKTLKETADGSDILSERILKLAKRSEALARIEISKGINNSEDQIKKSIEAITETIDDGGFTFRESFSKTFDSIQSSTSKSYDELLKDTGTFLGAIDKQFKSGDLGAVGAIQRQVRSLQEEFKLTKAQAIELSVAVSNAFTDKSIISVKSLENVLSDLNDETNGSNKKLVALSSSLVPLFQKVFDGVDNVNLLRQAFTDLGKALDTSEKTTSKYEETIKGILLNLEAQTVALEQGEEAAFRFATAQQLGLKVGEQIPANIDAQIAALFKLKKAQEETKAKDAEKKKASSFAGGIVKRGLSKEDKLQADLDQLIRDKALISITEFELAKTSIEQQQADLRKKIRLDEMKLEHQRVNLILSSTSQLFGGIASLLQESEGEQSNAFKAMFALSKGFAIAQATLNLSTAISQASILPFPTNLPAMAQAAASGAQLVSAISGASFGGGREHGGPVQAGKMFQVGEGGKPEIFTTGNKNFMIPGDNGRVISNDEAFGGGQSVEMNVSIQNNVSNAGVSTQMSEDGKQLKVFINEVASQISRNQGPVAKALRSSTNTTMKANR